MVLGLKSSAWFFKATSFFESGKRRKWGVFNKFMERANGATLRED